MTTPDFSPVARQYARFRPGYPEELFAFLAALAKRRDLALDCATGSGQAAVGLAEHFRSVVATDRSAEQLRHALPHPRVSYRLRAAERSGLEDGSVDLVSAAAAVHWFDLPAFAAEVRRVLRPGGVLAVWSYHVGEVEAPFDRVFARLYFEELRASFPPQVALVDRHLETVELPGEPLPAPRLTATAHWNVAEMVGFIATWSGAQRHLAAHGDAFLGSAAEELERLCGDRSTPHPVRWPLFFQLRRL